MAEAPVYSSPGQLLMLRVALSVRLPGGLILSGNTGGGTKRGYCIRTRVVPREKLREEGVVVGQRLAGGSRVGGSLARCGEVGELVSGLLVLIPDFVGDGAWKSGDKSISHM